MVTKIDPITEQLAAIRERLQRLEQKKFVGGRNIRISDVDEQHLLVEQIDDEGEFERLAERLNGLESDLQNHRNTSGLIAGEGLILKNHGTEQVLEIDPVLLETDYRSEEIASGLDDFPFRVRLDHTQPTTGDAKNFVMCAGGDRYDAMPEALIYAGTRSPLRIDCFTFQASGNCCIYLSITLKDEPSEINPGTITAEVIKADSYPVPDSSEYIVPIARILFRNGRVIIQQMQFGNVYIAGRVI